MADQDGDGSGGISKEEFKAMLWRLQIRISEHRVAEILTAAKRDVTGEDDSNNPYELNEAEFRQAMKYVEEKSSYSALELLGISST